MEDLGITRFWQGKRVFISGHTGFKGSWLTLWLNKLGADVTGYSLSIPTKPSLFESARIEQDIISIKNDIRNYDQLTDAIQTCTPDIIFHLAAQPLVRRSYEDPLETFSTNVIGTANVLEGVRKTTFRSVKAIIIITSDKCYENREWVWGYRETDPMGGYDPYSSSKGCAELISSAYLRSFFHPDEYKNHGVGLATARAGNVIGGGDFSQDRLIPDMAKAFSKNDTVRIRSPYAVRPWQHVLDPLYGYLELARNLYEKGPDYSGAWNFGPIENDVKEVGWVVQRFIEEWSGDVSWTIDRENHPHEAGILKLDCSKARSLLKWRPQMDINTALNWTIQWYKAFYGESQTMKELTLNQIEQYENSISST